MLDAASWSDHTRGLPQGASVRVEHDCGGGRVLKVSNGPDGYRAWCFRCNDSGHIAPPTPSLSERLAQLAAARKADERVSTVAELPTPRVTDPQAWPLGARVWLYKAGLSNDDIGRLGAFYHEPTKRVVLPVYHEGRCVYWQARSVDGRQPKYINPLVDKGSLAARYGTGPAIVLTEDILSAFRVARVCEAWSIMGTALAPGVLAALLKDGRPVITMFDPDSGGDKARARLTKKLPLLGVRLAHCVPHRDPKFLSRDDTRALILAAMPDLEGELK